MTPCDRCGGTEGKIDRSAHVAPDQCIRALQRQASEARGTINEMREERDAARGLVERLYNGSGTIEMDEVLADAQVALSVWQHDADQQKGGAT